MILGIDHLVIVVRELEQAITDYTALGFSVVRGGEHTTGATHNALVVFADGTYLELIAFQRPDEQHRWWRRATLGEGLIDFALLPDAIEDDIGHARSLGLFIEGPFPGGRARPDGQYVSWQTGVPPTPDLPFLCADVTPRVLRVPEGDLRRHDNGVAGIAGVTVVVKDLNAAIERYAALLPNPIKASQVQLSLIPGLGIHVACFALGSAHITLVSPAGEHFAGLAQQELRTHLSSQGEGPYAVALRVAPGEREGALNPQQTHGVRLECIAAE